MSDSSSASSDELSDDRLDSSDDSSSSDESYSGCTLGCLIGSNIPPHKKWQLFRERLRTNPEEAHPDEGSDWHPLGEACELVGAPPDIIRLLVDECPRAAATKGFNRGHYPLSRFFLHEGRGSSRCDASYLEAVQIVHQAFPDVVRDKHPYGCRILHHVCICASDRKVPFDVFKYIYDACPENVRVPDNGGNLALHDVFYHGKNFDERIVKHLIRAYPDAVKTRNGDGLLPAQIFLRRYMGGKDIAKELFRSFINADSAALILQQKRALGQNKTKIQGLCTALAVADGHRRLAESLLGDEKEKRNADRSNTKKVTQTLETELAETKARSEATIQQLKREMEKERSKSLFTIACSRVVSEWKGYYYYFFKKRGRDALDDGCNNSLNKRAKTE